MKITDAIELLRSWNAKVEKKSEEKTLRYFIDILLDLQNRPMSAVDIAAIENELDFNGLNDSPEKRPKLLKKKLTRFQQFLRTKFALTPKGYYTTVGLALGVAFGSMLGAMFDPALGSSMGLVFGIVFGYAIGNHLDGQAQAANKVLNVDQT